MNGCAQAVCVSYLLWCKWEKKLSIQMHNYGTNLCDIDHRLANVTELCTCFSASCFHPGTFEFNCYRRLDRLNNSPPPRNKRDVHLLGSVLLQETIWYFNEKVGCNMVHIFVHAESSGSQGMFWKYWEVWCSDNFKGFQEVSIAFVGHLTDNLAESQGGYSD